MNMPFHLRDTRVLYALLRYSSKFSSMDTSNLELTKKKCEAERTSFLAKDGSQTPFKWSFIAEMLSRALLIPHVRVTCLAEPQRTKPPKPGGKQKWRQATQTRQFAEGNRRGAKQLKPDSLLRETEVEQSNSNPTVCCPEDETQAATPDMLLVLPRSMQEVPGTRHMADTRHGWEG